jgi:hypothetical protein
MKNAIAALVFGTVVLSFWFHPCAAPVSGEEGQPRMLAHDVYFTLNDNSAAAKAQLVAACKKYLADHPGTVWFAAGTLAPELKREVNDLEFDVALHVVFKDMASHNQYQTAEKHLKFIAENKANWKKVRVFDSYLDATAHADMPKAK